MAVPTRAVVFDLFGTLVTYPPGAVHVRLMAEKLGVEFEALHGAWRKLRPQRDAGVLDTRGSLRICCGDLRIEPTSDQLDAASAGLVAFFEGLLTPRPGALWTIGLLRDRGLRIGMVSDSNIEVAQRWSRTAFAPCVDAAVFSSEEHVRKPDPALFRAVCERLAIPAPDCLYVGNGDGDELAGATSFGMRALLFTAPGEFPGREVSTWRGPRITDLTDVVAFV